MASAVKVATFAASLSQHQGQFLTFLPLTEHPASILFYSQCSSDHFSQGFLLSARLFLTLPVLLANPDPPLCLLCCPAVLCTASPRAWGSDLRLQFPKQEEVKSKSQEGQVMREFSNCLLTVHHVPTEGKAEIKRRAWARNKHCLLSSFVFPDADTTPA